MQSTLKRSLREGFGEGLVELGKTNERVFALAGDLAESTRADRFQQLFPDRFLNMGIAEQDMVGTAVGLSLAGKIPFVCSFSVFVLSRAYDQIRISVCYNNQNVKIAGSHAGITVGPDGATAQMLEDIAIMRALPNMTVLVPADATEARKATIAAATTPGPVFIRLGRSPESVVTQDADPFQVGKANILRKGRDLTIVACGIMVAQALMAADMLESEGIRAGVIDLHTIKPVDGEAIIQAARDTGAIVTAEEHQINGGLGGLVSEVLAQNHPTHLEMVAVRDTFGESGGSDELREKYGLTSRDIVNKAHRVLERKRKEP